MPGFIIAHIKVHDPEEYRKYISGFMDTFTPFEGKILVATDDVEILEGDWEESRIVVMEFPSLERARQWHQSPRYRQLARHRLRSSSTNMILAEGYAGHYVTKL